MSRSKQLEICGETLSLPVNYAAAEALADAGFDPLEVALAKPIKTLGAIVAVLHTGVKASGSKLTREDVGRAVAEAGALAYVRTANDYLAAFLEPEA